MKRSEPVELMNMCVLRRGSKVLVQDRTDPNWPGVAFPGGHVEKGESFTDSVIREVQEETGLTISSPRLCGIKDWCEDGVRHVVLLYRAEQFTGTLRSSDEGEVWWAELAGLPSLNLASSDMLDLLRVFEEDDLSELFYRQNGEDWTYELKQSLTMKSTAVQIPSAQRCFLFSFTARVPSADTPNRRAGIPRPSAQSRSFPRTLYSADCPCRPQGAPCRISLSAVRPSARR